MTVTMNSNGDNAFIRRSGSAIHVNGVACGAATVTNTDLIIAQTDNVTDFDDNNVTISHASGRFQPGATAEGGSGISEIEFQIDLGYGVDQLRFIGSSSTDVVVAGQSGGTPALNLNANEAPDDADVDLDLNVDLLVLRGYDGADRLSANGGSATGAAYQPFMEAYGGNGNDTLRGGSAYNGLYGGNGADTITGGGDNDIIRGGIGPDHLYGGGSDDQIYGDPGPDRMYGGSGSDLLNGGPGFDRMFGQSGSDALKAKDGEHDIVNGGPHPTGFGDDCAVSGTDAVSMCEVVY
jgi:Ca2+-binding RTX toxin-like protein